ncbi:MAG: aminoacyl-tRNA hydrolase [Eubacterium sp.]|nr:aminoacyl-tRNA hydrolase [Eubacterium sp.]
MYLIVGLGNPGSKYAGTRHNMGFDTIDELVEKHRISSDGVKMKGMSGRGIIGGERVILLKPMTYMNLSGEAVRAWLDYYKLDPEEDLIVIYDDVDQEPGRMRIRKKGSAGGHNGMKSIIQHIGTSSFPRIRIGVGAKPAGWDLADYVLGHFSKEDRKVVDEVIKDAADAVEMIISEGVDEAMNRYNSRGKEKEKEAAAKKKAGSGTTETTVKNE